MKLTRDEARILGMALSDAKYELKNVSYDEQVRKDIFNALEALEKKLNEHGKDLRRVGRTSQNDFSDTLKRYEKKFKETLNQSKQ
jgi:hypothetical protein